MTHHTHYLSVGVPRLTSHVFTRLSPGNAPTQAVGRIHAHTPHDTSNGVTHTGTHTDTHWGVCVAQLLLDHLLFIMEPLAAA